MDDNDPTPGDGLGPTLSTLARDILEHVDELIAALLDDDRDRG